MIENKQKVTNEKIEKIKVTDINIILTDRFPNYYEIKYKKVGEQEYRTCFGSYNLDFVADWKEENFELVTEERNEERKREETKVTNEELLKHLKELEIAQSCVLNGINSLFNIIDSKSELLQFDDKQKRSLKTAMIATMCMTEDMMEISGMNKRIENRNGEVKKFEEFIKDFLCF